MDKPGRNDPCPCGSGKKFKKCCALKTPMQKLASRVTSSSSPADKTKDIFSQKVIKEEEK